MKALTTKFKAAGSKIVVAFALMMVMISSAFASEAVTPNVTAPTAGDFTNLMNNIGGVFTTSVILAIIGAIVAFSAVYALIYWGARRAVRGAMSGVKRGKIRV